MASITDISKLEIELKDLQKQRSEVEYRLKGLESQEKSRQGVLGKRNRPNENSFQNKRLRDNFGVKDEGRSQRDNNGVRSFHNSGGIDKDNKKPGRLSSVLTGQKASGRDFRDSRDSRDTRDRENRDNKDRDSHVSRNRETKDEPKRPKLTSAIVSSTPIAVVGEKPRPSLDTSGEETKKRSKKTLRSYRWNFEVFQE